jgi:hypothetical protein
VAKLHKTRPSKGRIQPIFRAHLTVFRYALLFHQILRTKPPLSAYRKGRVLRVPKGSSGHAA